MPALKFDLSLDRSFFDKRLLPSSIIKSAEQTLSNQELSAIHVAGQSDALIAALKERARQNHRSLQGEVRSILEAAATDERPTGARTRRRLSLRTVSVGRPANFSRDVIYENADR